MDYLLTADEKEQLISLLDKIQVNHCENYQCGGLGWNCVRKSDNEVCPIEYKVYLETDYEDCIGCFYCPVSIIRDVLEEE